jgi:hypothetical protein
MHVASGHMMGTPHRMIIAPQIDGNVAVLAVDRATGQATYVVVPPEAFDHHTHSDPDDDDDDTSDDSSRPPRRTRPTVIMTSGTGIGAVGAAGVIGGVGATALAATLIDPELSLLWRIARTIRIYAIAELVIVAFAAFSWPYFAILLIFPILGAVAAWRYYFPLAVVYCCYFPIAIAGRIWVTYTSAVAAKDNETWMIMLIVIGVLGILIELYCLRLVFIFSRHLYNVGDARQQSLRDGTAIVDRRFLWW